MNPTATPSCSICGQPPGGKQTAFCSRLCKNKNSNYHHQSYGKQLERGRTRKIKLLMKSGGQCVVCGYANRNWDEVEIEAKKCVLLCSNCHAEHHNPGSFIDGV